MITLRNRFCIFLAAQVICLSATAQTDSTQRLVFEFTFQTDSTDSTTKIKNQYALDIFDDHSKFVSYTKLKRDIYLDSMTKAIDAMGGIQNVKSLNINLSNMGTGAQYEIFKFPHGKITFSQKFSREFYAYEEDMNDLNWNITDYTEKYGTFNCQLAKVHYGGRNWNALFTTDVPINNGPYKFSGLPGLIVKMWDDKNQCLFELAEIKTVSDAKPHIPKSVIVKKSEFKKVEENAPVQTRVIASGMNAGGGNEVTRGTMRDQNGNEISAAEIQRRRTVLQKKNNNKLELD